MGLRKVTFLAFLASGLLFCTSTQGHETEGGTVADRLALGYERAPSRAELEPLSDDLDATLVAIYRDPDSVMLQKMRALDLLSGHPSDDLRQLLVEELERDQLDGALRRRLLDVTMKTYGEDEAELAARALRSAFESDDSLLRYEAARRLEQMPDADRVEDIGRKALAAEADPDVRQAIQRALDTTRDGN